jgi:hypothetical protein
VDLTQLFLVVLAMDSTAVAAREQHRQGLLVTLVMDMQALSLALLLVEAVEVEAVEPRPLPATALELDLEAEAVRLAAAAAGVMQPPTQEAAVAAEAPITQALREAMAAPALSSFDTSKCDALFLPPATPITIAPAHSLGKWFHALRAPTPHC